MLSRAEIFEKLKEILLFADAKNSDLIKNCDESTKLVLGVGALHGDRHRRELRDRVRQCVDE